MSSRGGARAGAGRPPDRPDDECARLLEHLARGGTITAEEHMALQRYEQRLRKRASREHKRQGGA